MASGNVVNGGPRFPEAPSKPGLHKEDADTTCSSDSAPSRPCPGTRRGSRAPALSRDSGVSSTEAAQGPDSSDSKTVLLSLSAPSLNTSVI